MDQLNVIIKIMFELLIMAGCMILVIKVFFFSETDYGTGLWGKTGTTLSPIVEDGLLVNEGMDDLYGYISDYIPIVRYNEGTLLQGDFVEFKSLLSVELEDGSVVNGSAENGFVLYLLDIQTKMGNSVLEKMSTDELAATEEIPNTFVYDKELDMLYIFGSGTFTVLVRIYSDAGGSQLYQFKLPVELLQ